MRSLTKFSLSIILSLPISSLLAQDSPTAIVDVPGKGTYAASQDTAIEHFKNLNELVSRGEATTATLKDNSIVYLTAVYLLCTVGNGSCPSILQGVFETDLVNAVASGKYDCPLTKRFWKIWGETDMEQRHHFQMRITDMDNYAKFEKEVLPKYLSCEATLKTISSEVKDKAAFLKARYGAPNKPETNIFAVVARLLEKVKEKVPNVFMATGSGQKLSEQTTQ